MDAQEIQWYQGPSLPGAHDAWANALWIDGRLMREVLVGDDKLDSAICS